MVVKSCHVSDFLTLEEYGRSHLNLRKSMQIARSIPPTAGVMKHDNATKLNRLMGPEPEEKMKRRQARQEGFSTK
jgi:hypothetical protein